MAPQDNPLSGRTLRWTFSDGPTADMTFEHHFYADGTVAYGSVGKDGEKKGDGGDSDRPKYKAYQLRKNVVVASYLSESGYALTVALDFDTGRVVSFASNDKEWFPSEGTFEEVEAKRAKAA